MEKRAQEMTLKEALQQLCQEKGTHDSLIESCKYLCHYDYQATAEASLRALRLVAVPRLIDLLAEPPAQRDIDNENWVVFWAAKAVEEAAQRPDLAREVVQRGGVEWLCRWLSGDAEERPETVCVVLKAIALVSAGYTVPSSDHADNEEYVSESIMLSHYDLAVQRTTRVLQQQRKVKRSARHPFLLPLAAYAVAFLAANAPPSHPVDWTDTCTLFAQLLSDHEQSCHEPVVILCDSLVNCSDETRQVAVSSGFLKQVLTHMARGDFQGDLATAAFNLLSAVCDLVPQGADLVRDLSGMRALAKTLTELRDPAEQHAALKVALLLIGDTATDSNNDNNGGGYLEKAVADGLVVEAFLCLTEAKDLKTKQAALDVIDKIIRAAPPPLYNSMRIDPYFVLSVLAVAQNGPDADTKAFARQAAAMVIWMARNKRCDLDMLCSTGNYATAARIPNGMWAMSFAKLIYNKVKAEQDRERAMMNKVKAVDEKKSEAGKGHGEGGEAIVPSADATAEKPIATA